MSPADHRFVVTCNHIKVKQARALCRELFGNEMLLGSFHLEMHNVQILSVIHGKSIRHRMGGKLDEDTLAKFAGIYGFGYPTFATAFLARLDILQESMGRHAVVVMHDPVIYHARPVHLVLDTDKNGKDCLRFVDIRNIASDKDFSYMFVAPTPAL